MARSCRKNELPRSISASATIHSGSRSPMTLNAPSGCGLEHREPETYKVGSESNATQTTVEGTGGDRGGIPRGRGRTFGGPPFHVELPVQLFNAHDDRRKRKG